MERDYHRQPRMVVRAPGGVRGTLHAGRAAAAAQAQSGVGQMAGSTLTASTKGIQVRYRAGRDYSIHSINSDARSRRTLRTDHHVLRRRETQPAQVAEGSFLKRIVYFYSPVYASIKKMKKNFNFFFIL